MSFFQGKVVIVTGQSFSEILLAGKDFSGASNGIGRDTAKILAGYGAKLTITGRNAQTLQVSPIRNELTPIFLLRLKASSVSSIISIGCSILDSHPVVAYCYRRRKICASQRAPAPTTS